jgi:AcrR family transcriptional regulator
MPDPESRQDRAGAPDPGERDRIVAAFGRAAAAGGARHLTYEAVATYAGLPRERVEAHFPSLESGLLATWQEFLERLRLDVADAWAARTEWPAQVKIALRSILASLAESDRLARVFSLEVAGLGPRAAQGRFAILDEFAALLAEGRVYRPAAADLPELAEQLLVDGVASVLARQLLAEDPDALLALEPELVELVLCPYLGAGPARRVAQEGD